MDLIYDCQNRLQDGDLCSKRNKIRHFQEHERVRCKKCTNEQSLFLSESLKQRKILDVCPVCQKKDFYIQRDFPQQAGCLIVLIGALCVPWTYGLSLAVVAVLDFILYKMLPNITVCYHCLSKIRGIKPNPDHQAFDHNLFEVFLKEEREKESIRKS
jgi:ribosomal protein S27E